MQGRLRGAELLQRLAAQGLDADGGTPEAFGIHVLAPSLAALRQAHPAIARGSYDNVAVDGSVLSFERRLGSERMLVATSDGWPARMW